MPSLIERIASMPADVVRNYAKATIREDYYGTIKVLSSDTVESTHDVIAKGEKDREGRDAS